MTEKDIQALVDEVLKRILNQNVKEDVKKQRLLIISSSEADEKKALDVTNTESFNGYVCRKTTLNADNSIVTAKNCSMQTVMSEFDALFLSGLTLKHLQRIKEMKMEYPLVEIAAEAFRLGKPVYILSDWIEVKGTPAFTSKINTIRKTLISYGVTFVDNEFIDKSVIKNEKNTSADSTDVNRIVGRVVSKQCFKNIMSGDVVIEPDAVITSTAKALIEKRGINIIRLQR